MNSPPDAGTIIPSLDSYFGWISLTLIGLSGALFVAEALGFLPERVTHWINRNRLSQTLSILEAFGVDVDSARRRNRSALLDQSRPATVLERVKGNLARSKVKGPLSVGRTVRSHSDEYFDIMGATCDPAVARSLARDLTAHWREITTDPSKAAEDRFDFVATPKSGSPFLGAAFAELMRVPIVLHCDEPKFDGGSDLFRQLFDGERAPPEGARALVVDDSSTGGGKIIRLVSDLKRLGYKVEDALVVFEPGIKVTEGADAAQRLQPYGIRLHSITKT